MLRLVNHAAPKEIQTIVIENGLKDWLVEHLEEDFTVAELRDFGTWRKAREMEESVVWGDAEGSGLDFIGYVLTTEEEMQLQIRWRKEGDWRAGSVPEGPGMTMMNVQESVGDWRTGLHDQGWIELGMNIQESLGHRGHGPWNVQETMGHRGPRDQGWIEMAMNAQETVEH
jgi:hypothetical protein